MCYGNFPVSGTCSGKFSGFRNVFVPEFFRFPERVPEIFRFPERVPELFRFPERVSEFFRFPECVPELFRIPERVPEFFRFPERIPEQLPVSEMEQFRNMFWKFKPEFRFPDPYFRIIPFPLRKL